MKRPPPGSMDQETLERRLDDGYKRIADAQAQGRDVQAWEEFWIQLLREYEEVCFNADRIFREPG